MGEGVKISRDLGSEVLSVWDFIVNESNGGSSGLILAWKSRYFFMF